MPCGTSSWDDWYRRVFKSSPTDRYLARLENQHLKLARAARRTLRNRQLAITYEIKALAVFNQRVAIREQEERCLYMQAVATHNPKKAAKHQAKIAELQKQYISIPQQDLSDLNARPSPDAPLPHAMPGSPSSPLTFNALVSPFPSSPPSFGAVVAVPLPSAPPPATLDFDGGGAVGESVTYMSGQSQASRATPSSVRFNSMAAVPTEYVESPPPYYSPHAQHGYGSTAKMHVVLGQES